MFGFAIFLLVILIISFITARWYKPLFLTRQPLNWNSRHPDETFEPKLKDSYNLVHVGRAVITTLAVVLLIASSIVKVNSQEVAVLQQFGRDAGTMSEGLNFVPPWYDVNFFNTRIITIEYTQADGNPITGRAGDDATYSSDVAVRLRVPNESTAQNIFNEYGTTDGFVQNAARNDIRDVVRTQFERFDVLELDTNRQLLSSESCTALTVGWESIGVPCVEVDIRAIRIDGDVEQAAEDVNTASLRADAAVEDVRRARDLAQIEVIEAQAAFDAQQIFECGYTIDENDNVIPNTRDENGSGCDDVLSDRGLYVRCLAGRTGAVEGAQTNNFIVPPDCEAILVGAPTGGLGNDTDILVQP